MVQDTRELNRSAVLTQLMLIRPASRKQLAAAAGISAATATRAVEQLISEGLVHEVSELVSDQRGRRAVLLDLRDTGARVVGVDLGGSSTRMVSMNLVGNVVGQAERDTPSSLTPTALAHWLAHAIDELAGSDHEGMERVHVGLPGAIGEDGTISTAPNLPQIEDPAFRATLQRHLGKSVTLDNDTNLALLGEQHFGAAHGAPTAVMITLGAGLGSAISIDGKILCGRRGLVGEFGQIPAGPLGTRLEHMVTGPGLIRSAAEAGHAISSPSEIFAPDVAGRLAAIRTHFDNALLIVLTAAVVSCEPEVIILGGGIVRSLPEDLSGYEYALRQNLGTAPAIVRSALGDFAGALGAGVAGLHDAYRRLGIHEGALAVIPRASEPA